MNIYICELKEQEWKSPLLRAALRSGLLDSSEAKELAQNEKKLQNQREHLTAWLLFQRALGEIYGIQTLSELALARTRQGKPYSRTYSELHFNLSHCRTACACALDTIPAGVDIERRFPYKEKLMHRICTEKERQIVESCKSLSERERLLQALWSMKESIVKWNGRGIGYGMKWVDCSKWLTGYADEIKVDICLTPIKNAAGKQKFDVSMVETPEWENPTLQKQIKEEIVCGSNSVMENESEEGNPELWMLLSQKPEYTLAACTAERKGTSDDWLKAVQITEVREEELYE